MRKPAPSLLSVLSRHVGAAVVAAGALVAAPSFASAWIESGDAGQTQASAQVTVNTASYATLGSIGGTLSTSTDVDLFMIHIVDFANFSATTVGGSSLDTQLFLFTLAGQAIYANDDDASGLVFQSTLPAGSALGPAADG